MRPTREPDEIVRRIATFGLPGTPTIDVGVGGFGADPLSPAVFEPVLDEVQRLRLSGFLQAAVGSGDLPVTDEQRARVADLHAEACIAALALERRLLGVVEPLMAAGIDVVVLKGAAAAHLLYPDPAWRMFGDNDLLFPASQFDEALRLLEGLGYRRPAAPPRPGFDRRFGKGATLVGLDGDELDAHRTLLFGSFGLRIVTADLFVATVTFELGGRELRALGPETGLLHACYHAALGDPDPRLGSLRDVAQRFALGQHDPVLALELVDRWGAAPVVARAVRLCASYLGVRIDDEVARATARYRVRASEYRAIASYVGDNRSHAAKVLASVPFVDGLGAKTAWLAANLLPSTRFVRSRGGASGAAWIGRGWRSLRAGRRRP